MNKKILSSNTVAIFPILLALDMFKKMGINQFQGTTEAHDELLSLLPEARSSQHPPTQVKCFVSNKVSELNKILKDNHFDIQLNESQPFDLGVVAIMDLMLRWLSRGEKTSITYKRKEYSAVKVTQGASVVRGGGGQEVLMIRTREGVCVFFEKTDEAMHGLQLFNHVFEISRSFRHDEDPCDAVLPWVEIDEQPDMSWVLGLYDPETRSAISQILQQNRLRIGLDGVRAESATAFALSRAGFSMSQSRREFVIKQPFNIWLTNDDHKQKNFPLFAAHVVPKNWIEV
jgi:hypothetical protein